MKNRNARPERSSSVLGSDIAGVERKMQEYEYVKAPREYARTRPDETCSGKYSMSSARMEVSDYGNPFAHLFTRAPALHKCDRECAKWPFDPTTALPQPQKYLSILYCAYI